MSENSEAIAVHVSAETKLTIGLLAQFEKQSVSEYVRALLLEHVRRPDRRAALRLASRQGKGSQNE